MLRRGCACVADAQDRAALDASAGGFRDAPEDGRSARHKAGCGSFEYLADASTRVTRMWSRRQVRRMSVVSLVLLAALLAPACSGSPTAPTETQGPEGTGGESGESGTRYGPGTSRASFAVGSSR